MTAIEDSMPIPRLNNRFVLSHHGILVRVMDFSRAVLVSDRLWLPFCRRFASLNASNLKMSVFVFEHLIDQEMENKCAINNHTSVLVLELMVNTMDMEDQYSKTGIMTDIIIPDLVMTAGRRSVRELAIPGCGGTM